MPNKIEKSDNLGYYNVIGIYKGIDLKKFSRIIEQGDNPLYFVGEKEPPSRFLKKMKLIHQLI